MAEATLTAEAEVTPSEEVAVVTPDSPTEAAPAPENVEETSAGDLFLAGIDNASTANGGDDGANATPDEVVPPAQPTPEQIAAQVRAQVAEENRVKGLKAVAMETGPAELQRLFKDRLDAEEQRQFDYIINQMKGAVGPLADRAVDVDTNYAPLVKQAAFKEAEDFTFGHLVEVAKKELGEDAAKALLNNRPQYRSWQDPVGFLIKESRKGMVPAKDYLSRASVDERVDKLEKSLNERGAAGIVTTSLKQLMGSTGPDTPAATGGSGGNKTYANMTPEERAKLTPEQRDALIARQYSGARS